MPRKDLIKHVKRIVVKVGTSTICTSNEISDKKISAIVRDVSALIQRGYQVVIVSSGAIAAGAGSMSRSNGSLTIPEKQALASVGQTVLMNTYRKYFTKKGIHVGQILLTEDDIKNRRRFLNARHTLEALLDMGVVPVINENDSVVVKEIKFGDNDTLAAHVSSLINADLLILLSDIDGFYRDLSDPEPVEEIYRITDEIIEHAGGTGSEYGTGGMITKIRAAEIIIRFGEKMIIANGAKEGVLSHIMNGEKIGTIFVGTSKPLSSRKKWLAIRNPKGKIIIDDGAVEAVLKKKKSLLATGICGIDGTFDMGDTVEITDMNGGSCGKGIVNYNNVELGIIKGKRTQEIRKLLGYKYYDEVINRDDLIVF